MRHLLTVVLVLSLAGFAQARSHWRGYIACGILTTHIDSPAPEPSPSPFKCAKCKDTGWITHGDGHKTRCPDCSGEEQAAIIVVPDIIQLPSDECTTGSCQQQSAACTTCTSGRCYVPTRQRVFRWAR